MVGEKEEHLGVQLTAVVVRTEVLCGSEATSLSSKLVGNGGT
jgi:hypothetical protein